MGWRRANRIRPPIGTQLRLGQPALERAQTQPQHLGRRMLAGASFSASRHHATYCCRSGNEVNRPRRRCSSRHRAFCNISRAAASARALSLRRNSCSSCRMRFLSALDCAFSACCRARADCWPRIQAWRHCWACSVEPLAAAILTEFNLGKRSGFQHDGELGLGRPFIGQFVVPGHRSPSVFGVFSPIIQSDFADVFLPS